MKFLPVFLCLFVADEFPWHASLQLGKNPNFTHVCGASVIDEWWLITAAHCVSHHPSYLYRAVAGEHHLVQNEGEEQYRKVESIVVHSGFDINSYTPENDIALVKLADPLEFDGKTVSLINLPSSFANSSGDCVMTGWGYTQVWGISSDILMKVVMPIITDEECQKMFDVLPEPLSDNMICAGYSSGGKGACRGDSGGGLVCPGQDNQYYLAGVASSIVSCASHNFVDVFTEVSYYIDWINDVMVSHDKLPSRPNTVRFPSAGVGQ